MPKTAAAIIPFASACAALVLAGAGQAKVTDVTWTHLASVSTNQQNPQQSVTNVTPPSITGTAVVGSTLSGDLGSWSGKSLNYAQRWLRCDSTGGACGAIAGANGYTYGVTAADVGGRLRFQVTATSRTNSAVATSNPTSVVAQPASAADTTPPSAPTSLTVTAATTSLSLTWAASTDNFGVTGYEVFVNGSKVTTVTSTSATATSLTCGTSYTVGVDAYDAAGNRSAVSTKSASTAACPPPADTTPPSAPSSLSVTAAATTLSLAWTASTDNVGVTGYDYFVNGTKVGAVASTSATVTSLTCGTSYTVGIDAYDAAGNRSAVSTQSASTSACPPPPAQPIYWGAYINGVQTYSYLYGGIWSNAPWCDPGTQCPLPRFTSNTGKSSSVEHWGMCWTCTFDSGIANAVVARGDIPAVDWANDSSASDADVAAGKYDAQITKVAQAMAAFGHPLFLLFDEEMNGTWYPYSPGVNGNTAASFVAMWRHMHDLFVQAGASNVTWVWCPNVDTNGITPTWSSMASVYPGDAYVDWTGLNGYNWGSGPGGGWMSFDQVFHTSYANLLQIAPSKPIMLGEVASEELGGSKAAWITDMLTTQLPQNYPQIKAVLWFNWRIFEKNMYWNWEIESSAASQAAFANGIASSYYAPGGAFASLPLLTKVQPL
jgi:chitodextrinase